MQQAMSKIATLFTDGERQRASMEIDAYVFGSGRGYMVPQPIRYEIDSVLACVRRGEALIRMWEVMVQWV